MILSERIWKGKIRESKILKPPNYLIMLKGGPKLHYILYWSQHPNTIEKRANQKYEEIRFCNLITLREYE